MKILFGIFDWGLGHATRDIPLISELLRRGHKVEIITTGRAMILVKSYFKKNCKYHDVPSLSSPYTKTRFFTLSFIYSIPKIHLSLLKARKISKEIIRNGRYDKVISDCRYDVYDKPENSYLINHQLRFKSFTGGQAVMEAWLKSRFEKYKFVIVPDFNKKNLSGNLSHNLKYVNKSKVRYIGILSHIRKKKLKKDINYFFSLSGPEPQRTILEKKIVSELDSLNGKIIVAGGNPELKIKKSRKNVQFHSFFNSEQQQEIMNRSKFIITRSGYTTIMELAELNIKNALLIPTPGQTEQEYLGNFYEKNNYFHSVSQYKIDLNKDIEKAKEFRGFNPPWKTKESVRKFMKIIFND